MKTPDQFIPATPRDLIGPAGDIARRSLKYVDTLNRSQDARAKLLFYGDPGCGKTTIADMIAGALAAHSIDIESVNGRNVSIDLVRQWQEAAAYGSLFGGWKVKVINEADLIPAVAQDLLLTYLDELRGKTAIIGTSNATMATLSERFATRFSAVHVANPSTDAIAAFLMRRFHLPKQAAGFLAVGCCGNVRDALLQASTFQVFGQFERPKPPAVVKDIVRTEAARKAWDTRKAVAA